MENISSKYIRYHYPNHLFIIGENDNLSLSNDSIYILHYQKFNNEHIAAVSYGILY